MPRKKKIRIVRVAMIKAEAAWGDVQANLRLLAKLCRGLAGRRVDVVITPECFLDGYMVRKRKTCTPRKLAARCVTGPGDALTKRAARIAARLGSYLVIGASEKNIAAEIRNAAYLFDRKGKHVGAYYKVHPCRFYTPGDALPVFQTDFGKVGIVICADRRWPENIRCLRLKGAEIILNPTWGFYGDLNTAILRTRAYENGIPVCFTHPRQSLICLPDGSVGAVLESSRPETLVYDIDLSLNVPIKKSRDRASSHPIQNRRPSLYTPLALHEHVP